MENTTPKLPGSKHRVVHLLLLFTLIGQSSSQGTNVALGKTVTMSSVLDLYNHVWSASYAVDNEVPGGSTTDACRCCAHTEMSVDNWLTVDLGQLYYIKSVFVQGRTDGSKGRLQNIKLYTQNAPAEIEQLVFTHPTNVQAINWTAPFGTMARFVTLREPDYDFLVVCQIQVFRREECNDGNYGQDCTSTCGMCAAAAPCSKTDGSCPDGCATGWSGLLCQEELPPTSGADRTNDEAAFGLMTREECNDGNYGHDCTSNCGVCAAAAPCSKTDGSCPDGCATGWSGLLCQEELPPTSGADRTVDEAAIGFMTRVVIIVFSFLLLLFL